MTGWICVNSRQKTDGTDTAQTAVYAATWTVTDGGVNLTYRETDEHGATDTAITATPDRVTVTRTGAVRGTMTLVRGKSVPFGYDVGCGVLELAAFATHLEVRTADGLHLACRYILYQQHTPVSHNEITIDETAPPRA